MTKPATTSPKSMSPAVKKLLKEINKTIRTVQTSGGKVISVDNDIYEVVVFVRTAEAIKSRFSATVSYVNQMHGVFVARGSPGKIANRAFSYATFFANGKFHEMHLGVTIDGFSGVGHEADVSIINQSECNNARITNRKIVRTQCCLTVECKFYASNLNLHIGRSLIGYGMDVNGPNLVLVTNSKCNSIETLLGGYEDFWSSLNRHHIIRHSGEYFLLAEYAVISEFDDVITKNQAKSYQDYINISILSAKY